MARCCDPGVQGRRLAAVLLADQGHTGESERLDHLRGAVCRTVVDHDDLELGIVARRQRPDRGPDPELFVERRDHDGDRGKVAGRRAGGRDLSRMPSGQRQQQEDAQHRQSSQGDQCDLEHLDDGVRAPYDAGHQLALKALRRARRVPGRRSTDRRGDGVEGVAALLELIDQVPSAATVWVRSPPPSCSITTAPSRPRGIPPATIFSTPGLAQSSVSRSVKTAR